MRVKFYCHAIESFDFKANETRDGGTIHKATLLDASKTTRYKDPISVMLDKADLDLLPQMEGSTYLWDLTGHEVNQKRGEVTFRARVVRAQPEQVEHPSDESSAPAEV